SPLQARFATALQRYIIVTGASCRICRNQWSYRLTNLKGQGGFALPPSCEGTLRVTGCGAEPRCFAEKINQLDQGLTDPGQ
ncbi:MAG TPA: hypothetical protein VMI52_03785, partial [Acetobacteraceae bacterium]|nr:hypothetical protein [Acetobacteraceae bacterium]